MAPVPTVPFDNSREFTAFAIIAVVLVVLAMALLSVTRWQDSVYEMSCSLVSDIRSRFSSTTCAQSSGLPIHSKSSEMVQVAAGPVAAFVLFPGLSIARGVLSSFPLDVPSVIHTPRSSFKPTLASIKEEDEDVVELCAPLTNACTAEERVEEQPEEALEAFIVPLEEHPSVKDDVFSAPMECNAPAALVPWTIPHNAAVLWSIAEDGEDEEDKHSPRLSREEKGKGRARLDMSGEIIPFNASRCTMTPKKMSSPHHTTAGCSPSTPTSSRRHRETRSYWSPDTPVTPPQPSRISRTLKAISCVAGSSPFPHDRERKPPVLRCNRSASRARERKHCYRFYREDTAEQ